MVGNKNQQTQGAPRTQRTQWAPRTSEHRGAPRTEFGGHWPNQSQRRAAYSHNQIKNVLYEKKKRKKKSLKKSLGVRYRRWMIVATGDYHILVATATND